MEGSVSVSVSGGGGGGGVTVVGSDAPSEYRVAPRTDNNNTAPSGGSVAQVPVTVQVNAPAAVTASPAALTVLANKKRGRPRKNAPDGSAVMPLSPKPISSSTPLLPPVINFSAEKQRGKVRPASSVSKGRFELENLGERVTPHIITVNTGEDVTTKVISFCQPGPRAICILSAHGVISSVILRQPDSSGGTLTYEGRFEIMSLSGSFMPSETAGTRSRSGGMSVSLASPDGHVVGGVVAGRLVAASPVQVVVGSFLAGNQHEQNTKKQKQEDLAAAQAQPASASLRSAGQHVTAFTPDPEMASRLAIP